MRALCTRAVVLEKGGLAFDGPPMQAVGYYLGSTGALSGERVWDDDGRAPAASGLKLRGVRVRDCDDQVTAGIDIQDPFEVEVDFEITEQATRAGATLILFNDEGTMVFSTINNRDPDWHGRLLEPGSYTSTCLIPGDLLNGGDHTVSVLLWVEGYQVVLREDEVVRFHVHDSGGARGDYMGGMGGAVRPSLAWRTEQLL